MTDLPELIADIHKTNQRFIDIQGEHTSDIDLIDGDISIGEYELARRFPLEYDLRVNGVRHIVVRDEGQEYRYKVIDGEVISQEVF